MENYKVYTVKFWGLTTIYQFKPCKRLPSFLPISAPLVFAFVNHEIILVKKQNGWWDVPGGKIEKGETWIQCLKREAKEEAGIDINQLHIIGYILATNSGDTYLTQFPPQNILPIAISRVECLPQVWIKHETLERRSFTLDNAKKVLLARQDNGQLAEILDYIVADYARFI